MNYEINKTINGNDVPIMHVSGRIEAFKICDQLKLRYTDHAKPSKTDIPNAIFQERIIRGNEDSFGTKDSWESYDTLYDRESAEHIEHITISLIEYMKQRPQFFGGIINRLGRNYHLIPSMSSIEFENVINAINAVFLSRIDGCPSLKYSMTEERGRNEFDPLVYFNERSKLSRAEQTANYLKNMNPNLADSYNNMINNIQNRLMYATLFGNTYEHHDVTEMIPTAKKFPINDLGIAVNFHDENLLNRNQVIAVFNQYDPKLIIGLSSEYFDCIDSMYKLELLQKPSRVPGYEFGIQDISFELTWRSSPCADDTKKFSDLFKDPEWDGAYIIPMTWYNLAKCVIELQYGNACTKENLSLFIHNLPFYKGRVYTRGIRRGELDMHADAIAQQKEMIANLSDKTFFTVKTAEESK